MQNSVLCDSNEQMIQHNKIIMGDKLFAGDIKDVWQSKQQDNLSLFTMVLSCSDHFHKDEKLNFDNQVKLSNKFSEIFMGI